VRRVLITGAAGFVGSRLTAEALARGISCRCLVRSEARASLLPRGDSVEAVLGDVTRPETLVGVAEGCDTVFHLAAEGHVSAVTDSALRRFTEVNVTGTENLIRAVANASTDAPRFVHFSSTAAMGLVRALPATEEHEPQPVTPYQRSKYESEIAAIQMGRACGVPVVVLRPCMIYGPGGAGEFRKMAELMRRGRFPKVGRGKNLTPLVHVNDVVRAALLAAESGGDYETYLIASERSPALDELRAWIMEGWGESAPYPYVPTWLMYAAASALELAAWITGCVPVATRRNIANTVYDRQFSIAKAERDFHWRPLEPLRESVIETVRSFETGQRR
jgi:nucleoside-diphosphate-sugar epimerase